MPDRPDATSLIKALADAGRLLVARLLCEGSFHVSELCGILDAPQSTVSRNLKILVDADLVAARREGRVRWYSWRSDLSDAGAELRAWVRTHGPSLTEDHGRRIAAVWEERRARTASFFEGVDPHDPAAAWLGSPDCVPLLVGELDGGAVLDLGTGTGRLLPELGTKAERVIGVDASASMLEAARNRAAAAGLDDVDLRLGDFAHLPVGDGEVDAVVANMVLHHVAEPARVLPEILRVLRPGGRLLIGDFLPHDHEWMRDSLADQWLGLSPTDLSHWLTEAGFSAVSIRPIPSNRPDAPGVFVASATRAATTPSGS